MIRFSSLLLIVLVLLTAISPASSQNCMMYEVRLASRIQQSMHIVEGTVTGQQSFWNTEQTRIYTAHEIRLEKLFKGTLASTQIIVVTEGGQVGEYLHVAEPELKLELGNRGTFMLEEFTATHVPGTSQAYRTVAAAQGFYKYQGNAAHSPFDSFDDIERDLYPALVKHTGVPYTNITNSPPLTPNTPRGQGFRSFVPVISGFTPDTITAGTFTALTINGTGFGPFTAQSMVEFKNADDGGSTWFLAPASHIQSWTNTQIIVWVPTNAGTGQIRVTDSQGASTTSSSTLIIRYNLSNLTASGIFYRPVMRNINSAGGVDLRYNSNFANYPDATAAFERALETWRCNTFIRFDLPGINTTIPCQGQDNTSVINWDTACALPAGLLGRTYTYFTGCQPPLTLTMTDVDILFKKNISPATWYFGTGTPGPGQFDFESLALHELGHAHLLGHVIAPSKVMHYVIGSGTTQRVLSADDIDAGTDVMNLSTAPAACGPPAMQALNSGNCGINTPIADFIAVPREGCEPLQVFFFDQSTQNPTSWQWDVDGDGIIDYTVQDPSHIYTQGGTYTVTLIVSNANGVDTMTKNDFITVNRLPVADAGIDRNLCLGDTTSLGGTPAGSGGTGFLTYAWTPSSGLLTTASPNPKAIPSATTTYTLTVTDDKGCQAVDSVTVTVIPKPTANAGSDFEICAGEMGKLGGTPTGSGGSGPLSFYWTPDNAFADPTEPNPDFVATASTTFIVTVTDTNQCSAMDAIFVTVNPLPTADAGQDVFVCEGLQTQLGGNPTATGGTPGYTYVWQPFQSLSSSSVANPLASPSSTVSYTLTIFDSKGCFDQDTVRVGVFPRPTVNAGINHTVCAGTPVTLGGNPTGSGGTQPYIFGWQPTASLSNPAATNPIATPSTTTSYTLTMVDANGCLDFDTVTVTVRPSPVANAGSDKALCGGLGSSVIIGGSPAGSGGTPPLAYSWSPTFALSNPNTANPTATPGNPITYILTVTDANGCFDKDTMSITVNPPLAALAGADDTICSGECINLGENPSAIGGDGNYTYTWVPSTGNPPAAVANPRVCPTVTTTYTLALSDGKSCQAFDEMRIVVRPSPTVSFTGLDTSYCTNSPSVTLSGNPPAGTFSGPGISGSTFSPSAAGVGTHAIIFAFTGANGCTGRDTAITTVKAIPPKPTITKSNDTLHTGTGYANYQWLYNGVPILSADKPFFTGLVPGTYEVIGYGSNGCTNRSDVFTYTAIETPESLGIKANLYPNPASHSATISLQSDRPLTLHLSLYDTRGRMVIEPSRIDLHGSITQTIAVAHLASGMYFVRIELDGRVVFLKLMKE